jgi:hypothetical protein
MVALKPRRAAPRDNPYVGPRPFRASDRIYGRDREARELTGLLVAERVVLLHSPSGAGKTSLLQAAVLPGLHRRGFRIHGPLRVNAVPPDGLEMGNRYAWSVVQGLAGGGDAAAAPRYGARTIAEQLSELSDGDGDAKGHLLVFDQFEEIVTLDPTDRSGQAAFFEQVGSALEALDRWALFSIREDYMGGLTRFSVLIPTHLRVRYRLDFLEQAAARSAVQRPAAEHGVEFTGPAADALIDDLRTINVQKPGQDEPEQVAGPYVEPVQLQVVCNRLWRRLARKLGDGFTTIEPEHVAEYGQFDEALAHYYAEAVADVAEEMKVGERAIRDWIDDKLITKKAFRSQYATGPDVDGAHVGEVLAKLERRYLIRGDDRAGTRWYELTHDRLVRPVRDDNRKWRRKHLERWDAAADEWRRSDRPDAYLLVGPDVLEAKRWLKEQGEQAHSITRQFIEASRTAQGRNVASRYGIAAVIGFSLAFVELIVILLLLAR